MPLGIGTGGSFPTLVPPWQFSPGQTSLTLNPVIPVRANAAAWDWTKGEFAVGGETVPNIGPQVVLHTTNRQGLQLTNTDLCLTFGDQSLNPWETGAGALEAEDQLVLNGITGCYELADQQWRPDPGRLGQSLIYAARESARTGSTSPLACRASTSPRSAPSSTGSPSTSSCRVTFQRMDQAPWSPALGSMDLVRHQAQRRGSLRSGRS